MCKTEDYARMYGFLNRNLLLLIFVTFCIRCIACSKKYENSNIIDEIIDVKDFKKLLRTKTNVLVLFTKSATHANQFIKIFRSVSEIIKGEGTLVYVDCNSEAKKLCKKMKISPEPYILKHFKDGEFHKDYDRKETVQSMVTFMRDPSGDVPWEEDDSAIDVVHLPDSLALAKLIQKESKPALVMFYAPWCGFCKRLKPDYAQAATDLKKIAILGAMDVNKPENAAVRQHFNISGFPTLIYFENGKPRHVYEGENNKEAIINFVKNPHQPKPKSQEQEWHEVPSEVVHLTDATFDSYISEQPAVLVMFYAPWCGHCKAMKPEYVNAAAKLKTENIQGILAAVDATKESNLASKFGVKGYPTVKFFKNGEYAFDVSYRTADQIIEFMKNPKEPPPPPPPEKPWHETESRVWHLDDLKFKSFLKKKKHALVMFYAPWCGHCKRAKPEFEKAAEQLQDDLQVAFAAVDCTVHTSLCNNYDVHGFPTLKYFSYLKNITNYNGERTEEAFVNFMKNPNIQNSSPTSEPEDFWSNLKGGTAVVQLTSSNFKDFIQNKSVLVMFYAPWCGHCKAMKSAFAEAAENLKKEDMNAVLAAVDGTMEKSLTALYDVKGYPTIKYFRNGQFISTYNRQRTSSEFQNFMTNPPISKDEL